MPLAVVKPQTEECGFITVLNLDFLVQITADGQSYLCLECGKPFQYGKKAIVEIMVSEVSTHVCGGK